MAVILSAEVSASKLTLIRSIQKQGSKTSESKAAINVESNPPEKSTATGTFYSVNIIES
jgi:hypothetical protein